MDNAIVTKWLEDYKQAWVTRNEMAIVELFTSDGQYFETPFLVYAGREEIYKYWTLNPGVQRDIRFQYQILSTYDSYAIVHWSAQFNRADDSRELDGIFLLDFTPEGKCKTLREWWHSQSSLNKAT